MRWDDLIAAWLVAAWRSVVWIVLRQDSWGGNADVFARAVYFTRRWGKVKIAGVAIR